MTVVKICGVRSPHVARTVSAAGADLFGLIFAPARRRVTVEAAREIVAAARESARRPLAVGVFVDERPERMAAVAETAGLDVIQLSGDEAPEVIAALPLPVVKALRVPPGTTVDEALREVARYLDAAVPPVALLLDTHVAGSYGGSGLLGDWELAAALAREVPLLLAGGLRAELVPEALARVRPLGIDVSSGVETDGEKDHAKIRAFVAAARRHSPALGDDPIQRFRRAAVRPA